MEASPQAERLTHKKQTQLIFNTIYKANTIDSQQIYSNAHYAMLFLHFMCRAI